MKIFILTIWITTFFGCTKNDSREVPVSECLNGFQDFKPYNGEEIDCKYYYLLTEHNDKQYLELASHCADLTRPFVIDENCRDICTTAPYSEFSECGKYFTHRKIIKVILIEK